ncbi:MAG: hydrogen gas-evolving membrane-bound hydrogenase subunit E [Actinomycetota bacterium]
MALVLVVGVRRIAAVAFACAAIPAAATAGWALTRLGEPSPKVESVSWVEGLDLGLRFAVGPYAALLTVIVSGVGLLVFIYAVGYFGSATDKAPFAAALLAFSGSMVGLIWAADVWTLFLFWEATSITSFLLVGTKTTDPVAHAAARRALLITVSGGLALLAGFLVLAGETGTTVFADMEPVGGDAGTVAAVLVLVGALTKSAQVPFHVWLPGAMAAPTPVSAYLHSATMVKAGIVLLGLSSSVFVDVAAWTGIGVTVGLVTMVWGGIGALRHADGKLILAWGTVSQLGLMTALMAYGSGKAIFAGVSLIVAHALFKAPLFMVVGEIDVRTGTRDGRELSGLRRSMPLAFAVMVIAGLSMAGVPPLLGFPAKEAAIEAGLGADGVGGDLMLLMIVAGSILTVAYTTRLVLLLFADRGEPTVVRPRRPLMEVPAVILATATVVGFVALGLVNDAVIPAAVELETSSSVYELLRWPGFKTAFWISMAVIVAGGAVGAAAARRASPPPEPIGAEAVDRMVSQTLALARWTTGRIQHGSLPVYLAVMAVTAALATIPFVDVLDPAQWRAWDHVLQAALGVVIVAAGVAIAVIRSRIGAALGLGIVGFGVSALFMLHGAPDLALTQLLVETVIVVAFVIGLGRLTSEFPPVGAVWRSVRIGAALVVGSGVTVALLASGSRDAQTNPELVAAAVDEGGGNNLVNVVLTDVRALDTLGEVLVLVVAAIGVVALGRADRARGGGAPLSDVVREVRR